jgi:hypothetical protein
MARTPGGDARYLDEGPLAAFTHDVQVTRFDTRVGRLIPVGLAGAVAVVAANAGSQAAIIVGIAVAVGLGGVVLLVERDRWRAQDVLHWYLADRAHRWVRDTGGTGPRGDPAATEVWLGTHQPGTVPQIYRALAALHTGDPRVRARELAAMPDVTPEDRAWRTWVNETDRWNATGAADTSELAPLIGSLPATRDRAMFESWLAAVEASRRHAAGDPGWIQPLSSRRTPDRRTRLGPWLSFRIWLSRFAAVLVFGISAAVFSSLALTIAEREDQPRPEYADTEMASRGSWPVATSVAADRVVGHLRALERALAGGTRVGGQLDDEAFKLAIDRSLPTFNWTTGAIDFASPPDAAGRRVWEVEVLLNGFAETASAVIVRFDGPAGPRYLYRIDTTVVNALRADVGLPARGSTP